MALKFESFDGGRDSKERLLQGLLVAATKTPEKSLIVVFTDNGTKDLKLKDEILVSFLNSFTNKVSLCTYIYMLYQAVSKPNVMLSMSTKYIFSLFFFYFLCTNTILSTAAKKGEVAGNLFGFDT